MSRILHKDYLSPVFLWIVDSSEIYLIAFDSSMHVKWDLKLVTWCVEEAL